MNTKVAKRNYKQKYQQVKSKYLSCSYNYTVVLELLKSVPATVTTSALKASKPIKNKSKSHIANNTAGNAWKSTTNSGGPAKKQKVKRTQFMKYLKQYKN